MLPKIKKLFLGFTILLVAGIALSAFVQISETLMILAGPRPSQIPFDKESWSDWQEQPSFGPTGMSSRQKMIHSLVKDYLPGLTRKGIEELLGKSLSQEDLGDVQYNLLLGDNSRDLAYIIGLYKRDEYDDDFEYLFIRISKRGYFEGWRVIGARHWRVTIEQ